eukprot:GHVS01108353.1.p2 GENE.GHVS01108353.1~~GHVS01108353.1.p2  ORF type:complete len:110 (+),score=0.74 GHVS01108353.1:630-959(+)
MHCLTQSAGFLVTLDTSRSSSAAENECETPCQQEHAFSDGLLFTVYRTFRVFQYGSARVQKLGERGFARVFWRKRFWRKRQGEAALGSRQLRNSCVSMLDCFPLFSCKT